MMKLYTLILLTFHFFTLSIAQDKVEFLFSYNIHKNIKSYYNKAESEFRLNQNLNGEILFDSLVKNHLIGTFFDDFEFDRINKNSLKLSKVKKPILLLTFANWCILENGEIPALNELAKRHKNDVQIIVLFWNQKKEIVKLAQKFNQRIEICYVDELQNKDCYLISTLKHTLGLPVGFLIDENKQVINIFKNRSLNETASNPKQSFQQHYSKYQKHLSSFSFGTTNKPDVLVTH